jgi:hypothetical protein
LVNVLLLVPPTVGTIGIFLSLLSLVPLAAWDILVGRRLLELGEFGAKGRNLTSSATADTPLHSVERGSG